jgi:hypothetical protein
VKVKKIKGRPAREDSPVFEEDEEKIEDEVAVVAGVDEEDDSNIDPDELNPFGDRWEE